MITLYTGTPGTGKTALVVAELLKFRVNNPTTFIYVHGIRNLRGITHETIYCKSQLCDICASSVLPDDAKYVEDWQKWKQPDTLIIVDEVQRIWRPRVGSSQVHESVSALETHRHYGVDFWLISQGAHLFDNFIRLLVGRHIHLVSTWSGRKFYEWSECHPDTRVRSGAVVRPYRLSKEAFKHYDSAELHTEQVKNKPIVLYVLIALVISTLLLFFYVRDHLNQRVPMDSVSSSPSPSPSPLSVSPPLSEPLTKSTVESSSTPLKSSYPDFTPTIAGVPESAPAYAPLLKVTAVPLLVGCLYSKSKDKCTCYTSQATIYPTSKKYCLENLHGNTFNPYYVKSPPTQNTNISNTELSIKQKSDTDKTDTRGSDLVSADVHMTASDDM